MPRFKHLAEAGSGGTNFVGNLNYGTITDLPVYLPGEDAVDYSQTTSVQRAIATKYINYATLNSWEFYVEFTGITNNSPFCVIGTDITNQYYYNPTLELKPTTSSLWFGLTTVNGRWELGSEFNLDEDLDSSKTYGVKYGWDGEQVYIVVKNITDNTIVGEYTMPQTTRPHTYGNSSSKMCFCNCAAQAQSRFPFYGKILLKKCYVKENGVVTWGNADA